ncbi:MAG: hypothetical protein JWQ71_1526 [Pedosphaera sp.]|nr:hypothetical protein [Pedosphaera sp.]
MPSIGKKFFLTLSVAAVVLLAIILLKNKPVVPPAVPLPEQKMTTAEATPPVKEPVKVRRKKYRNGSTTAPDPNSETNAVPAVERERMRRMAENLLKPQLTLDSEGAAKARADWAARFNREPDPLLRQEIVTEMVQLDDPQTIKIMTDLLSAEKDSSVRQQLILILGYMRATVPVIDTVSPVMMADYQRATDMEERQRILEVMSNLPTGESVKFMEMAFTAIGASAEDRFNAAEGLFKLAPRAAVDSGLIAHVTDWLKQDAKSAANEEERLMAAQALAAPGQDNKAFLHELLATETVPKVRKFLQLASQQYPTQ